MARGRGFEFWCCAIPLINVGAYVTAIEIALVAFILAILALVPDAIIAGMGVIPDWAKDIVAVLAFVTFAWQFVGLFAIKRESTRLYHTYVRITTLLTLAILGVTIAFYIVAATQHDKAQSTCNSTYGALPSTTSSGYTNSDITQNFGDDICNYFIWAQIGCLGGLIVLLGLVQLYMCFALRAYGVAQRAAFRDYKTGAVRDDEIPLSSRNLGTGGSDAWDHRDTGAALAGRHARTDSAATYSGAYSGAYNDAPYDPATGHGGALPKRGSMSPPAASDLEAGAGHAEWAPYGNSTGYPAYAGGASYPAYETRADRHY